MTQSSEKPTLIITGASGCIGRSYAKAVTSSANLILIDRNESDLSQLCSELSSSEPCKTQAMT